MCTELQVEVLLDYVNSVRTNTSTTIVVLLFLNRTNKNGRSPLTNFINIYH
jgi:hypothetical protein